MSDEKYIFFEDGKLEYFELIVLKLLTDLPLSISHTGLLNINIFR